MNRTQFMLELAALLQDISVEERTEAMKYYNDYFDEAGEENEAEIIRELGSPAKVAAEIKAGLNGKDQEEGEFSETGYTDPRFSQKDSPARQEPETYGSGNRREPPRSNRTLKIILIILIILFGLPIILPVALVVLCVIAGLAIAAFAVVFACVVAAFAIAVIGVVMFFAGIVALVPDLPAGLALIGSGLLLGVVGVILTVVMVRICMIVLPGMFRFFVELCRRPFHRKKAVS